MPELAVGDKIAFDYIKSQFFRVIHADGAIGSITPSGMIHFALYSERPAIPRRQVQQLVEAGRLGDPIPSETESRESVVREMDVDVILTVDVAMLLRDWLDTRIKEHPSQLANNQQNSGEK